jgi:hypothetical protein
MNNLTLTTYFANTQIATALLIIAFVVVATFLRSREPHRHK